MTSPAEIAWAVRRLLECCAEEAQLIVVFDDLHWGEPVLLDLIEHVADFSRGAAILILCLARPELLDRRPGWGGGKLNAASLLLEPLAPAEAGELVDQLAGGSLEPRMREPGTDSRGREPAVPGGDARAAGRVGHRVSTAPAMSSSR